MDQSYYSHGRKQIGFFSFLRDVLISKVPVFQKFTSRVLLPYSPDFIFLTHPRNSEDIFATFPFIRLLRKFFPDNVARKILKLSPCYIVAQVKAPRGLRGYIVSAVELPNDLFASRELTNKLILSCVDFFRAICNKKAYIGLAAWWPIVSNSGQAFKNCLQKEDVIKITNGHTATLASIYLSICELTQKINLPLSNAKILIIGAGKVGGGLGALLVNKVAVLGLIDKNKIRLKILKKELEIKNKEIAIDTIALDEFTAEKTILDKLQQYHLAVCTTSNTDLLISDASQLRNCIIIDDSRPEAFPRIFSPEFKVAVLEGGLMKIPGVVMDSDFGFGQNDNIFGCLSEAIILAMATEGKVKPNIGELDVENLMHLIDFCNQNKIQPGDFKCAQRTIKDSDLASLSSLEK